MTKGAFLHPVTVLVGLGVPRSINNVREAFAYLDDVPTLHRDEVYHATCDAFRDAMTGRCSAQEAHDVFVAYARRRGFLLEGPLPDALRIEQVERIEA
jgi:hypothetical protein